MIEIVVSVALFTSIILVMVAVITLAKARLIPSGNVTIRVNDRKTTSVPRGGKLLTVLSDNGIFVASPCGGGGTCAQCAVKLLSGGGHILPTELVHISRREAREGRRLACQVPVKHDMEIEVPPEALETRQWQCRVVSNRSVATFIKELVLKLAEGEEMDFKAGGYIQIQVPPHRLTYRAFDIDEKYHDEWDRYDLWRYESHVDEEVTRAYSMANYPAENSIVMLNVRIAIPPPDAPEGTPPGQASSYIYNLKPGDQVSVSGPFGEFYIRESDREMIYLGGGAGMAPLRSHILELLRTRKSPRRISYWYGARSLREVFYQEEFELLERDSPNFSYRLALSQALPEDNWTGLTGFIHQVLFDSYLRDHPAPEDAEYYICGPPMMVSSALRMLENLGVESESIFFDDFGG